jgi:hypothetical protein
MPMTRAAIDVLVTFLKRIESKETQPSCVKSDYPVDQRNHVDDRQCRVRDR